jgi:hypothetical protein
MRSVGAFISTVVANSIRCNGDNEWTVSHTSTLLWFLWTKPIVAHPSIHFELDRAHKCGIQCGPTCNHPLENIARGRTSGCVSTQLRSGSSTSRPCLLGCYGLSKLLEGNSGMVHKVGRSNTNLWSIAVVSWLVLPVLLTSSTLSVWRASSACSLFDPSAPFTKPVGLASL